MHTVHLPAEGEAGIDGVNYAATGIFFDPNVYDSWVTKEQEETINEFFDSLKFDSNDDPVVDEVKYADLINAIDFSNRWTYRGSVTTPPCATYVHWNVMSTIYPIKERHLKLFKKQLDRAPEYYKPTLSEIGNYREVQKIDEHDVVYIMGDTEMKKWNKVQREAAATNDPYAAQKKGMKGRDMDLSEDDADRFTVELPKSAMLQAIAPLVALLTVAASTMV